MSDHIEPLSAIGLLSRATCQKDARLCSLEWPGHSFRAMLYLSSRCTVMV